MYKGCALTRDAPALIVMPDIVGIQTVRDGISLDADAGKQRRFSANRDLLVAFGHCMKDHNLSPYIKKQDNPHGLPCKSKGRASEDALPVVHNNPPSHDPAAWLSVPLPRPGERGSGAWRKKPPRLPVMETGAVHILYWCSLKRSRNYLRGFLIAAWAGAKITERSFYSTMTLIITE